jgi:hypothetical protein
MSRASVYVRAVDGRFYKDPIVVFTEGFVCFDDDDPPELVLWTPLRRGPDEVLEKLFGGRAHLGRYVGDADRYEPLRGRVTLASKMRPASSWFFMLRVRIPATEYHGGVDVGAPRGAGAVYDFPR